METKIRGPVTVEGIVTVEGNVTDNTGFVLTSHDALYRYAGVLESNGVKAGSGATVAGMPRWALGAGERVKGAFEIPVGWDTVAFRWGGCNESAVAGNTTWELNYSLAYITGTSMEDAGTTIAVPAIAVGATQYAFQYNSPSELAAIDVPSEGFLHSKPFLKFSLTRVGGTLVGDYGVALCTLTRI